mgnify:CR=1 FL=1
MTSKTIEVQEIKRILDKNSKDYQRRLKNESIYLGRLLMGDIAEMMEAFINQSLKEIKNDVFGISDSIV